MGFSEIEPFPCELLTQRHPSVPNLGDVTKITETGILMFGQSDLLVHRLTLLSLLSAPCSAMPRVCARLDSDRIKKPEDTGDPLK